MSDALVREARDHVDSAMQRLGLELHDVRYRYDDVELRDYADLNGTVMKTFEIDPQGRWKEEA